MSRSPQDVHLFRFPAWGPALAGVLLALALSPVPAIAQGITFTDVALESGFQDPGHGRALVAADWDGDGWVDFYVGNPTDGVHASDDNYILWSDGPNGDGLVTFSKGQVLLTGEIAFTASAADFDNDGDPDLFVGIGGQEGIGRDYLYRNDDGVFIDVSESARVRGPWAPDGRFVPVATSSGNWADYDNDGDLDLHTSARIHQGTLPLPNGFGSRDSLFRNNGDGTFTDVSEEAGVASTASSMTASWGDFDDDGWMDLYVPILSPSDFRLYRNRGDGTFQRVPIGKDDVNFSDRAGWASSVGDFNADGRLDIISWGRGGIDAPDSHALLMNRGAWRFANVAKQAGIVRDPVEATMGTAIGDMDNDGFVELYTGNGGPLEGEADTLYWNRTGPDGLPRFEDVSHMIDYPAPDDPDCEPREIAEPGSVPAWVDHRDMLAGSPADGVSVDTGSLELGEMDPCNLPYPYRGHGSIFVDYDKDGDLDLLAVKGGTAVIAPDLPSGEPDRLFRNDGGNEKNWLFVELGGTVSTTNAYGAKVAVRTSRGGADARTRVAWWQGNTGFSATGPDELHFGLGDHDTVESVRVQWPSGLVSELPTTGANQRLQVEESALFHEGFDEGQAPGWNQLLGDWAVQDDRFGQHAPEGRALVVREGLDLADQAVVGRLQYVSGDGTMMLAGRVAQDGSSFYAAVLAGSRAQVFRFSDGEMTPLGEPVEIAPPIPGRAYIVRLEMVGSEITLTVDRRSAPTVTDSAIARGSVALGTTDARATFDNVAVQ